MVKLNTLRIDLEACHEGIWVEYAGAQWKISALGTERFGALLREIAGQDMMPDGTWRPGANAEKLWSEALARGMLKDWRDIENDDGTPFEYSLENALELLRDPEFAPIRTWLLERAKDSSLYRRRQTEAAVGNSSES